MEVRLHASLHTKGLTGVSHLTLAYMMGWTYVRSVGRTVGRSVGRSYDDVITKISRMDGLPYFLSNGAPRARAWSSAITYMTLAYMKAELDSTFLTVWHLPDGKIKSMPGRTMTS